MLERRKLVNSAGRVVFVDNDATAEAWAAKGYAPEGATPVPPAPTEAEAEEESEPASATTAPVKQATPPAVEKRGPGRPPGRK